MTAEEPQEPTEDRNESPTEVLVAALQELHLRVGSPSMRSIAAKVEGISHTTVATTIRGEYTPPWNTLAKVISALGEDPNDWKALWMEAKGLSQSYLRNRKPVFTMPGVMAFGNDYEEVRQAAIDKVRDAAPELLPVVQNGHELHLIHPNSNLKSQSEEKKYVGRITVEFYS